MLRFLVETLSEHGVALKQVAEGPLRVACFRDKSRLRPPPTIEHGLTELGSREEPDGVTRHGEERLYEVWQQSEAVNDHTGFLGHAKYVFDDHAEALSA